MKLISISTVVFFVSILAYARDFSGNCSPSSEHGPESGPLCQISPLNHLNQYYVKTAFDLARMKYVGGRYKECLDHLVEMNRFISSYKNSEELKLFCLQGIELVRREQELKRIEKPLNRYPANY